MKEISFISKGGITVILKSFALLIFSILGLGAHASTAHKSFVKIKQGHEVYTEYFAPKLGRPTLVLINGLVYDLKRWDPYTENLIRQGVGVLRYNFRGQSRTLLKEVESKGIPQFFEEGLSPEVLAQELSQTLNELGVNDKVTIVGLSYGAGIAATFTDKYPKRVDSLILLAPLVVSLDRYDPMGAWIRWNLDAIRFWWGPVFGPTAYDYYYDMIFRSYLVDQRISQDRIPKDVAQIPEIYKESVFHQVRAMRDFDLREYSFKNSKVHLFLASEEEPKIYDDQLRAWNSWDKGARASLVYFDKASHAIPDAAPVAAAYLTALIVEGEKAFSEGRLFRVEGTKVLACKDTVSMKTGACQ